MLHIHKYTKWVKREFPVQRWGSVDEGIKVTVQTVKTCTVCGKTRYRREKV